MSALDGTGILSNPHSNYFSFLARKPFEGKLPDPSEVIFGSEFVYVIDSRERDTRYYPSPSKYVIKIGNPFKNVTSIELKGSIIPKTEKNVNSSNWYIPFNVQDYLTSIKIKANGYGYIDGVYTTPDIIVDEPGISGGTNATVTATVLNNVITTVSIVDPGSGYLRGLYGSVNAPTLGFYPNSGVEIIINIPKDNTLRRKWKNAVIEATVGNEIVAKLRPGQYDFTNPNDNTVGLCAEVTLALQTAIDDAMTQGIIVPTMTLPDGIAYFPTAGTNRGSCYLSTLNLNASGNGNVNIQRGDNAGDQSLFLELLFGSSEIGSTAVNLLGFGTVFNYELTQFTPLDQTSGTVGTTGAWSLRPITGRNNYNLGDSSQYVILEMTPLQETRMKSESDALNKGFAVLAFDANYPDVVFRAPGSASAGTGDSNYATLLAKPGIIKGIKGNDFDTKVLDFGPSPVASISEFQIEFKKYNGDYYDFQGRDHILIFNIAANDINSGNRF